MASLYVAYRLLQQKEVPRHVRLVGLVGRIHQHQASIRSELEVLELRQVPIGVALMDLHLMSYSWIMLDPTSSNNLINEKV